MSSDNSEKNKINEEVINDLTKDLQSQLTANNEKSNETANTTNNEEEFKIPADFEKPDTEIPDDFIDEENLEKLDNSLTPEEKLHRKKEALELKNRGNNEFKNSQFVESLNTYTEALKLCPVQFREDRAIFYANRAACKIQLDRKKSAIDDCTMAVKLNDKYVRAYLRRAKLYEETEKLDESLEDYKKIMEIDPGNKEAVCANVRLPPLIQERNEKLKDEMLGKLKDFGNMILKPFGLSTNNFKMEQDPNSGGYSINFQQNPTN